MTEHQQKIIDTYKSGLSLREAARRCGISYQRVHQILEALAPEVIRRHKYRSTVEATMKCKGNYRARIARRRSVKQTVDNTAL